MLGDYAIDRTEVTNRQFKRFVDDGGYRRRELWKEPFVQAGKTVSWEQAMALLHDRTGRPGPANWELGDYPDGQGDHPVTGVSWYEAAAYAAYVGKELPNAYQWAHAAGTYATPNIVPASNFRNSGTVPVASLEAIGPFGTQDMAGNAKEWCWNAVKDGRRFILGGGWNEPTYMFNDADAQAPLTRGPAFGFRLVKRLDDRTAPEASAVIPLPHRDYRKEKSVRPEVAQAYRRSYTYDRGPLDARVRGDRRQLRPLAKGEGELCRGLRGRAGDRLPHDPAERASPIPGCGSLPWVERDSRSLEQDAPRDEAAEPDPPERSGGDLSGLQVHLRAGRCARLRLPVTDHVLPGPRHHVGEGSPVGPWTGSSPAPTSTPSAWPTTERAGARSSGR